jgi:YD repeat-containing protein
MSYDTAGRLVQVEADDGRSVSYAYTDGTLSAVTDAAGGITRYETDPAGRITQIADPDGVVLVTNAYDAATGRLTHQGLPNGGAADFVYDDATGLTTVSAASGAQMTFQADASGRMARITDGSGNSATFAFDANGNLTGLTTPGGAELAQSYDTAGNLLSSTFGGATSTYSYDSANRVTAATDPLDE